MDTIDNSQTPVSSRQMLGGVTTVVSVLLVILQLVLLIFFRIHRETMPAYSGISVHFALNPMIVWVPFWIGLLLIIWWTACRKQAPKRQLHALIITLVLGIGLLVAGSLSHIPEPYHQVTKPDFDGNMLHLPELHY